MPRRPALWSSCCIPAALSRSPSLLQTSSPTPALLHAAGWEVLMVACPLSWPLTLVVPPKAQATYQLLFRQVIGQQPTCSPLPRFHPPLSAELCCCISVKSERVDMLSCLDLAACLVNTS